MAGRVASWWAGSHQPPLAPWPSSRSPQTPFLRQPQFSPPLPPAWEGRGRADQRKVDSQGWVSGWAAPGGGTCESHHLASRGCSWAGRVAAAVCYVKGPGGAEHSYSPSPRGPPEPPEGLSSWAPLYRGAGGGLALPSPRCQQWRLDPGLCPPGPGHTGRRYYSGTMARSRLCRLLSVVMPAPELWRGCIQGGKEQEEPIRNPTCCGFLSSNPALVKGREMGEELGKMGQRQ